ncbi:MAG TPA: thrombospondin type 3 repeat-containing protein [Candidatus Acidoferrales bacterium]|nr:thrombospondin type 3 repeat-containing protein [Candidatus Acidoferrales bacterium]
MRSRSPLALALLAALVLPARAPAAPEGHYSWITPMAGWTELSKKLAYPGTDSLAAAPVFGLRVGHMLTDSWALELAGAYAPTRELAGAKRDVTWLGGSGNLMYLLGHWGWGAPYLGAGWGASGRSASGFKQANYMTFEQEAGWTSWFNDHVGLRFEFRNVLNSPKAPPGDAHQADQQYWAGLTFALGGKPRDSDGDGVPDRRDRCPNTPAGAVVDATGCPKDSDGDGVYDGLDKCPNTPRGATVDASGCPHDSDGDGVYDGIDKCPNTPKGATVDADGCPKDSDGDGVYDGLDKCPNTPKGAIVDADGCPKDSDGDGVPDGLDKCPDTPPGAKVDADGCPIVVTEKETELLDTGMIRLQNVNFETGKSELLPDSYPVLDEIGPVLLKWPQLQIEIGGHTDSRGSAPKNQQLSEARAAAVKAYLMQKFPAIVATQLSTKGYGSTKPIAPNNNALNMAKNRRVEFVVLNKDVLKKEVERRKMLQK